MGLPDFTVVTINMPPTSFQKTAVKHYLYMRQNVPKPPAVDDERTLFIANVPVDSSETCIKALFSSLGGRTESVRFSALKDGGKYISETDLDQAETDNEDSSDVTEDKDGGTDDMKRLRQAARLPKTWTCELNKSGSAAHVTFVEKAELKAVLRNAKKGSIKLTWANDKNSSSIGLKRYLAHQQLVYPNPHELQASSDNYMELFAKTEAQNRRHKKLIRSEPDEDGFVTVTRGGRSGAGRVEEAEALRHKSSTIGIVSDLYRFQKREEQKQKMTILRSKFEDDKRKIAELKARRKFKVF